MRRFSKKREKINRQYNKKAKQFREDHPYCEIKSPVCTGQTQGVHHKRGRMGSLLMDETFWMAARNRCNGYVEDNDSWARENGFKLSRLTA
jgi:hypothetical protein